MAMTEIQGGSWAFPQPAPEGWTVVPPDTHTGPDGVEQNWTVFPEEHRIAQAHGINPEIYEAVRRAVTQQ